MSNDDKPDPGKPTAKMEAVPDWAVAMTTRFLARIDAGFDGVDARLDAQDTKLDKAVTESVEANVRLDRVETRMSAAEGRMSGIEERQGKASLAVRGSQTTGLEHDAQLAQERAAREALATKVDELSATNQVQLAILSRLDKVTSNPVVKTIATVIGTAFLTWAASKGLK